ncbi:sigma-70 family RNA polymerase sigma factor [Streptomyces sp. NPDC059396]|uniref:sigma-70 family RNA polymerase sigma factor n=1 Tax=Streptomyces sp. NPDC059396 TaxID=3346819 RepID=UPI00369489C3
MSTAAATVAATYPAPTLAARWRLLLRSLSQRHTLTRKPTPPPPPPPTTPAIDDLYHHRRLHLVRLALLLVDDLPTAEDVVQDAFAALFRRYGENMKGLEEPEAYIRTCVINGARSVLRRRRTVRAHVPERETHVPPAEDSVLLREEHREVLAALRRLTRRQREVLVLRYWSNLTEAQIAHTLGVSNGTVKSTASRALDTMARHLEVRP